MGYRLGIGGYQNSGKSYGRRWIPDGENVMIIQPSVKSSHLFTGPKDAGKLSPEQLDEAVKKGTRKAVSPFNVISPEGKFKSIEQALALQAHPEKRNVPYLLDNMDVKKPRDYFKREHLPGNIMFCEKLTELFTYLNFVNSRMPWIHTVILPDFTHFISEEITSATFRAKKRDGEQYSKYLDLAADSLRNFIKSADKMRHELIVVTEYHVEWTEALGCFELFTPGGKMIKEKFLPSSYYDVFLFTDTKVDEENEEEKPEYRFVTRRTGKYPEARSMGLFEELYIPNNTQEVLTRFREYNGIALK